MNVRQALRKIAIFDPNVTAEEPQSEEITTAIKYVACVAVAVIVVAGIYIYKTSAGA